MTWTRGQPAGEAEVWRLTLPRVAHVSERESARTTSPVREEQRGSGLRPEIQLLRAVAVLAVVFNHLAPGKLPGGYIGVDIFFVISGYLITGLLVRELERSHRVRLLSFWARRARRLLPASLLVLLASAIGTLLVVPLTQWSSVMRQIVASALYVQNWLLAHDAMDYFASTDSPSPVTHYWSLSLEEQFYLVWPLIAVGAYAVGRRWSQPKVALLTAFGAVVVSSLVYSVAATAESPLAAYYVTPARMWQLGIGGMLALTPALVRGRHAVAVLGWVALLAPIALLDEGSPVPGWITLVPVLGAAAVIWAGNAFLVAVPRALRPGVAAGLLVGAISYSLYLWHWPVIVISRYAAGGPLTAATKLVLLVVIFVASWLSTRLVEDPIRRLTWLSRGPARRTFVPAVAAMAVVVMVCSLAPDAVDRRVQRVSEEVKTALTSTDPCFGARAIANSCSHPHRLRYPDSPLLTVESYPFEPSWGTTCLQTATDASLESCQFGVPRKASTMQLALIGDSHARHWNAALEELAVKYGWNVTVFTKGSCPANASALRTRRFPEYVESCRMWNGDLVRRVAEDRSLDVVITSASSRNYIIAGLAHRKQLAQMELGYLETWEQWTSAGKKVVVIGDVPRMQQGDIPTCVVQAETARDPCTAPARKAASRDPLLGAARASADADIVPVDLRRFFCSNGRCHSVIGGVVAYGDQNHLLPFFAASLAPYLYEEMRPAL